MKLFKVMSERDGKTIKEPGIVSTEVIREESWYAAQTIQQVWDAVAYLRDDPEREFLGITEALPQVEVLPAAPQAQDQAAAA